MHIYDRDVSLYLIKHDGRGALQDILDVSNEILSIGDKTWEIDSHLVRINPSKLSFRLHDQTNSTYSWIQTSIVQPDGLVPPFVMLTVDGVATFFGTVELDNVKRIVSGGRGETIDDHLEFSCSDWSRILADSDVTTQLLRPLPTKVSTGGPLRTSKVSSGTSCAKQWLYLHYWVGSDAYRNLVYFPLDSDWLIPGDTVICTDTARSYIVESCWIGLNPNDLSTCNIATLTGFQWPQPAGAPGALDLTRYTYTFTRQASFSAATPYLTATAVVTVDTSNNAAKIYTVKVDSVNGVYPGDKLNHIGPKQTTSYEIRDILSDTNTLVFTEPLSASIVLGDHFSLDDESYEYALFQSFKSVVSIAANSIGGGVDFSRFTPHTFTRPFLSWLPFRGTTGDTISSPNNINAGLTTVSLKGPDLQMWSGTPETGYAKTTPWTEYADWTQQLTTTPSSLMPVDTSTYNDYAINFNRPRTTKIWKSRNDGDTSTNDTPSGFFVYDYTSMKRYEVSATRTATTFYSQAWSGTSYGTRTALGTVNGFSNIPLCAVAFPAVANTLLTLQRNGTLTLRFGANDGATATAPVGLENGTLVRTPYGVYLLGLNGAYAKIGWTGSALHIDSLTPKVFLPGSQKLQSFRFLDTTLTALDASTLYVLGNISYLDSTQTDQKVVLEETWLFNLDPNATSLPSIQPEKIANGSYSIARTIKDPTSQRIIGLLGGRLFQVSKNVTDTFMRFKPDASSLDLIEHLCMMQNAIAMPGNGPTFQIISRNITEVYTTVPGSVEIVRDTTSRTDSFISQFEVKGLDDSTAWRWLPAGSNDPVHELASIKRGGESMTINCGDYGSTISQCASLGADYADFFGKPRVGRDLEVIYHGSGAAPYESYKPLQRIKFPLESTEWHVMGVTYSIMESKATIKLLQAY